MHRYINSYTLHWYGNTIWARVSSLLEYITLAYFVQEIYSGEYCEIYLSLRGNALQKCNEVDSLNAK